MPHSKPDVAMHGTRLNLPLGFSPRRSGPKRLGSERCGAALTAPSLRQAFTAVPHPRRGEVSVHTRQLSHIPLATHVRNLSPPLLTRRWHRLRSPRAKAGKPPPSRAAKSSELRCATTFAMRRRSWAGVSPGSKRGKRCSSPWRRLTTLSLAVAEHCIA